MRQTELLRRLLHYVRPYGLLLAAALGFALFQVAMTLSAPVLIGQAVDAMVAAGQVDFGQVGHILFRLALIVILAAVFQWLMTLCTNACCYRTVRDLRVQCFRQFHALPLATLDGTQQGDFMNTLVNDIDVITDGLLQGFTQLFTGVITIVGTLGFMLSIHPMITLAVVLITPLSLGVASLIASRSSRLFKQQARIKGELSGFAQERIHGQSLVAAYNQQTASEAAFDEINERLNHVGTQVQFISSLTNPCTRFVNNLAYAAVGIIGALTALEGGMSVGQLTSFLSYASQYTKPFNEISGVVTELQASLSSCERVFRLLDLPQEKDQADQGRLPSCRGELKLEHVSFRYQNSEPLIEDFNLTVKPGQKIAIVGPTGCGKTTLINLLMRFYEIRSGSIWLDDWDIRTLSRSELRRNFGMVLQDSWIFCGTIRENIAYGNPDASLEAIEEAARKAHLDYFIRQLPQGYDTLLDETVSLSQGQKQLLCIARVLVSDPKILILDEATSSIDTRTELLVQSAFDRMMKGRTSFVVAHRLSTIEQADQILVMNHGQIVEQGTHHELLKYNGFYAQLYNSQFAQS
ncbi:ABC transporter ATP-binding protein [Holdemania massiliensis]|uniref:ABC transporter ATP-binding protein n=1 Tax=Holdemania massiliensis TaxID=1468449 RepID=UPI001F066838|nr:ABC transporter ATP-binding protein [Holdemania massiliensis]MCH1940580.1 ABC transporter ATP-binding protein/permease [Holdemania massiliensis]